MSIRRCAGLALLLPAFGIGQPSFEVASVKVHEGPSRGRPGVFTSGTRLEANARTVTTLIMYAYSVRLDQVAQSRALDPFGGTFYDIDARAPGEKPPDAGDFRRMMQSLLAERFQLKMHREMREMPVYEMVVGRNGPKFQEAAPEADATPHYSASGRNWETTVQKMTMPELATLIENNGFVGRHVIDKTGLAGNYSIKLTYTPDIPPNHGTDNPGDIPIFNALVEQLGLRLEPAKATIETIVVDHLEKPSAN
ncbi:MAG TPA: TIGR03435 family protein [Verrucomicrobiae bacterium]|nr:TIGR03435 family protein [Verrucomicrobiae bacterium]